MKRLWVLGVGCWVLGSMALAMDFSGSYEKDLLGLLKRDGGTGAGALSRLRFKFDQNIGDSLTFHLEPRYYLLFKSQDLPLEGVSDLDKLVWDRYYLKARLPVFSVTAGKQRIAWGSGYIWNPTDIFNPYVLSFAVSEADESNVEAVRVEVPVGEAGGVDAFALTGKWGLRGRGTVGLFDLSASYVDQGTLGHQIGLDTSGDLVKDFGVHGEIALKTPPSGEAYFQTVLGGEYTLDNGIALMVEYNFDGQSRLGHCFTSASKIIDELTSVKLSLLNNVSDGGFLVYPQYTRSLSQYLDLNVEGMVLGGPDSSEFVPPAALDPYGFGGSKMLLVKFIFNF
jgi:hypothetical protein